MQENPWIALFELAARQRSIVTRRQARGLGIDDQAFTRRVRSEQWKQTHRGVYMIPGARWGPLPRLSAALLAAGPHAAATGLTALHVHGVVDAQPGRLSLVVPHDRRARSLRSADVVRTRTLLADDLVVVDGLRCSAPARAFFDATPEVDDGDLGGMLIDARQRRIVTPEDVIERAAKATLRLPGRRRLLAVAADIAGVGADSVLSDRVHRRLIAEGLHPDSTPATIAVGGRMLHPDITFASAKVCIECDSLAHHQDQRALDLDHLKDQAYAEAGWRGLRVGWRRYDLDWTGFVTVVRHALDEWPKVVAVLEG